MSNEFSLFLSVPLLIHLSISIYLDIKDPGVKEMSP